MANPRQHKTKRTNYLGRNERRPLPMSEEEGDGIRPSKLEGNETGKIKALKFLQKKQNANKEYSDSSSETEQKQELKLCDIKFETFGEIGKIPQFFKHQTVRYLIPDGLSGSHYLFSQPWRFQLNHGNPNNGIVCITWKLTNLQARQSYEITETPEDARIRQIRGRTIANRILRLALKGRIDQLTIKLLKETNRVRKSNLKTLIRIMQVKRVTEGNMAFGLYHNVLPVEIGE